MASVRVTGYTPVYRGRGKRRELVKVMKRTEEMKKPVLLVDGEKVSIGVRSAPRLLVDDVEVKIGVKRVEGKKVAKSQLTKTWAKHVGGQFDVLAEEDEVVEEKRVLGKGVKKEVKGSWAKSLKKTAAEKHGSMDAWASKEMKSYEAVLSDSKRTLEEELAELKANTKKAKSTLEKVRRDAKREEFEVQKARFQSAEESGDWGDIAMEMEALAALEEEISAVWD